MFDKIIYSKLDSLMVLKTLKIVSMLVSPSASLVLDGWFNSLVTLDNISILHNLCLAQLLIILIYFIIYLIW